MAGGWAPDGAVNEQIEASIKDELTRMQAMRRPVGASFTHCAECEEPISEARQNAVPGVKLCLDCQQERDTRYKPRGDQPTGVKGKPAEVRVASSPSSRRREPSDVDRFAEVGG